MNDVHWDKAPGDSVRKVFESPQPGLPQDEPWMDIVHMTEPGFTDMFQKHRNILIFNVDPSLPRSKTQAKKDVWSEPQIVIQVQAPTSEALALEFSSKADQIFELVREAEYRRLVKAYMTAPAKLAESAVKERFGINLNIPLGYNVVVNKPDFIWMKRDAGKYQQGILIYSRPYQNKDQFNDANILLLRDTMTTMHVPGPLENEKKSTGYQSHMAVEWMFPPIRNVIELNGNYAVELRGEWMVTKDFMGGPFVNYTWVDTLHQKLICMDGYVYNPGGDKRDALIHVEGVFRSVSLAEPTPGKN